MLLAPTQTAVARPSCLVTVASVARRQRTKHSSRKIISGANPWSRAQTIFRTRRGKIVSSTAYSIFVPCGLKIGDATSSKMYYVTSHKA